MNELLIAKYEPRFNPDYFKEFDVPDMFVREVVPRALIAFGGAFTLEQLLTGGSIPEVGLLVAAVGVGFGGMMKGFDDLYCAFTRDCTGKECTLPKITLQPFS